MFEIVFLRTSSEKDKPSLNFDTYSVHFLLTGYRFVCEDFPKEHRELANKTTNIGLAKTSNFLYTLLANVLFQFEISINDLLLISVKSNIDFNFPFIV
jgi:hypothetical protein